MTSVLQLLRLLTKQELTRFSKFLRSPFFGQSKVYEELFDVLRTFHADYTEEDILKKKSFQKFVAKQKNGTISKNIWMRFRERLEKFIEHEQLETQSYQQLQLQSSFFVERRAYKLFLKSMEIRREYLENEQANLPEYHLQLTLLNKDIYFHPSTEKLLGGNYKIAEVETSLDDYYHLQKLRLHCEKFSRQKLLAETYNFEDLTINMDYAKKHLISKYPLANIYVQLLDCFQQTFEVKRYTILRQELFKQAESIPKEELRRLFILLLNVIKRACIENNLPTKEQFNIYQKMMDLQLLTINNRITDASFLSILYLQSDLGEFAAAHKFHKEYRQCLSPKNKNRVENIGLAIILFREKEYDKVLNILREETLNHPSYQEIGKPLVMRSLYELEVNLRPGNKCSNYLSLIEAFRKYLSRSTHMSEEKKEQYRHFLTYFRQLLNLRVSRKVDISSIQKLLLKVQTTKLLFARKWLEQKVKELLDFMNEVE